MTEQTISDIRQYLTFVLDNEVYAFDVLKIKEVLELTKITKMPKTPPYMAGVINLRGGVVPVIDLRVKFDMKDFKTTVDTSIIIVEVNYDDDVILIGALVDSVKAVIRISSEDREPPPKVGMNLDTKLIDSIGKHEDAFVMLLNVDRLFSTDELSMAKNITGNSALKEIGESSSIEENVKEEEDS